VGRVDVDLLDAWSGVASNPALHAVSGQEPAQVIGVGDLGVSFQTDQVRGEDSFHAAPVDTDLPDMFHRVSPVEQDVAVVQQVIDGQLLGKIDIFEIVQ